MIKFGAALRERMTSNLADHSVIGVAPDERRRAAVAVVVVDTGHSDVGAGFLLSRRASRMSAHSAQWALPGGRLDAGETAEQAALRELHEELGIDLTDDAIIGRLDDYPTRSGYVITPVVVWGGGTVDMRPDPAEVAAAYQVGLGELYRPNSPRFVTIPESDRPVVQVPLLGVLVHAPTGAVLVQFRWVVLDGLADERVAHFEQPVFAWK